MTKTARAGGLATVLLALGACATVQVGGGSAEGDGGVADIFMTANQAEIDGGQLATQRAQSAAVREFAQRMITDHTTANQRTTAVLTENGLVRVPSESSRRIAQAARATLEALRTYEGAAFDRAYMQNQVAMHEYQLRTLDEVLIPAAGNNELEALLRATRPIVAEHLQMAQQILSGL